VERVVEPIGEGKEQISQDPASHGEVFKIYTKINGKTPKANTA